MLFGGMTMKKKKRRKKHKVRKIKSFLDYLVVLSCLGLMYIGDERFKENIDKYGEGTSEFMAKAIEIYCSK